MKRSTLVPVLTLLAGTFALSGCTDVRRALGIERTTPDEFAVTARPPLTVPPDFALRPPGGAGAVQLQQNRRAEAAVFGPNRPNFATESANRSAGESALLETAAAGATVDPDVRQVIDRENPGPDKVDRGLFESIMFWQERTNPSNQTIDPKEEADRLKSQLPPQGQPAPAQPK